MPNSVKCIHSATKTKNQGYQGFGLGLRVSGFRGLGSYHFFLP